MQGGAAGLHRDRSHAGVPVLQHSRGAPHSLGPPAGPAAGGHSLAARPQHLTACGRPAGSGAQQVSQSPICSTVPHDQLRWVLMHGITSQLARARSGSTGPARERSACAPHASSPPSTPQVSAAQSRQRWRHMQRVLQPPTASPAKDRAALDQQDAQDLYGLARQLSAAGPGFLSQGPAGTAPAPSAGCIWQRLCSLG